MITLIGKELAKKGQEFVFLGPAEDCKDCRFKSSCIGSLEENRKYVIVEVRTMNRNVRCTLKAQSCRLKLIGLRLIC
jgi:uncharacterized protein (UPF0179 family)